ncbi:hypothetical protein [Saccharopolyspora hattusasensis]|uniref:hypothetical protein n=1 Tax=Saccharopolyspora hattusasensis TaxID=1128679 RepID=UPI003D975FD8
MTGENAPLVLIERDATSMGGHWYRAACALTRAAGVQDRAVTVLTLDGVDATARDALVQTGATVLTAPPVRARGARALWRLARLITPAGAAARRFPGHRRFPHQLTLLARALAEAAAVRVAHREPGAVPVVLTASEGLPGLAALLGGPHVRIVHDVITTADRPLRLLARATRRHADRVVTLCPTHGIRAKLAAEHPGLPVVVRPFALHEHRDRLTDDERTEARHALGLDDQQTVVTLVGGWWPHKDLDIIEHALRELSSAPVVLVAGSPLEENRLARWKTMLGPRLHVRHQAFDEIALRKIYAVTDLLLVARRPGVVTESGLVCDALRYGVPLAVSDHDPDLTGRLTRLGIPPWLHVFPADDPTDLARAITAAVTARPPRPGPATPALLGLATPDETLDYYTLLLGSLTTQDGAR